MVAEVEAAAAAGLDCCWIPERDLAGTARSAPAVACALRPQLADVATLIELSIGSNPLGLAEELAVSDQILRGRVTGVLVGDEAELAEETADVLEAALASRPISHVGRRWKLPRTGDPVQLTPPPAQLELRLWVVGATLTAVARERGLPWVADETLGQEAAKATWGELTSAGAGRCLRTAIRTSVTVESLLGERDAWGLGLCVVRLAPDASAAERRASIDELGRWIRPQVQGPRIPEQLLSDWSHQSRVS
jgi:alkanesulfonate monooxygenase SsuD/methylene tetrahydromethanopterin reductase-like flavin-dependent oxidoreductase (luciferase family)